MLRVVARLAAASTPTASPAAAVRRRPVRLLVTPEQCQSLVERLLSSGRPSIAVDCEGAQLGRFGRLSLMQIATEKEVFLVDVETSGPEVVQTLKPLLASRELVKVFHDCREDASLLFHQHGIPLAGIFDTQVGHMACLERQGLEIYQASLAEVMRTFRVAAYRAHRWDELERHPIPPLRWQTRPLDAQAVRYAVEGVAHLLPIQQALCRELADRAGDLVLRRSVRYVEYAQLNRAELPSQDISGLRPGSHLQAMLATRRPDAAYFKLNHAPVTGAVLDPKDLRDFADLQPGDVARCVVKSISDCKLFLHLQRDGHGQLAFDRMRGEMRRLPSMEEVRRAHPPRPSSFYGLGQAPPGARSNLSQEPASYREQKPEVFYKLGKRGVPKVRDSSMKVPKRQADHRSFPMGNRVG